MCVGNVCSQPLANHVSTRSAKTLEKTQHTRTYNGVHQWWPAVHINGFKIPTGFPTTNEYLLHMFILSWKPDVDGYNRAAYFGVRNTCLTQQQQASGHPWYILRIYSASLKYLFWTYYWKFCFVGLCNTVQKERSYVLKEISPVLLCTSLTCKSSMTKEQTGAAESDLAPEAPVIVLARVSSSKQSFSEADDGRVDCETPVLQIQMLWLVKVHLQGH